MDSLLTAKGLLAVYLLAVNLAAFVLYGADKRRAKQGTWRIPEKTLLCVAALGGSLGGLLGMYLCHHKTKHPQFYITLPILVVLHVGLTFFLLYAGILR